MPDMPQKAVPAKADLFVVIIGVMLLTDLINVGQCTWPVCDDQRVHQATEGERCG